MDNLCNSRAESLARVEEITGRPVIFYPLDLRDRAGVQAVFERHCIDAAVHFAGFKSVAESVEKPLMYYQNNIDATLTLCDVMKDHDVKNLVFSSSATVYGNPETVPIKEDAPTAPFNPYGRSKRFIEEILTDLHDSVVYGYS